MKYVMYLKSESEKNYVCIKHTHTCLIYIKITQCGKMLITDSRGCTCSFYSSTSLFKIL